MNDRIVWLESSAEANFQVRYHSVTLESYIKRILFRLITIYSASMFSLLSMFLGSLNVLLRLKQKVLLQWVNLADDHGHLDLRPIFYWHCHTTSLSITPHSMNRAVRWYTVVFWGQSSVLTLVNYDFSVVLTRKIPRVWLLLYKLSL